MPLATTSGFWRRMRRTSAASMRRAMGFQQARDAAFAQAGNLGGCRRQRPQIEEPIDGEIVTEFERLRIIAPGLLADAVGQPVAFLLQVLGHAGEACYFALK